VGIGSRIAFPLTRFVTVGKTTTRKATPAPKAKSRPPSTFPDLEPLNELLRTPPTTTQDRLIHIRALGERIAGYVRFMCAVDRLNGSSLEVKDKAVAIFYERLALLEQELGRIQEKLQLE
jgi:hypothetical protein